MNFNKRLSKKNRIFVFALLFLLSFFALFVFLFLDLDGGINHTNIKLLEKDFNALKSGKVPHHTFGFLFNKSKTAVVNLFFAKNPASISKIPSLRIAVGNNTLSEMKRAYKKGNRKLNREVGGFRPYFNAAFLFKEKHPVPCKISFRGMGRRHYRIEKPSFRIKFRKKDLQKTSGESIASRYLEINRPEDELCINAYIPEIIGKKFGLMSSGIEIVRVFINQKYYGVYEKSYRPSEFLATEFGRLPGTFFKLDDDEYFKYPEDRWRNAGAWKVFGEGDEIHVKQLQALLNLVQEKPNAENLESIREILDVDAYAKWTALMILVGSTHADYYHNHIFYINSNSAKLEPVISDPNAFGILCDFDSPVDFISHPIMDFLTHDVRWGHLRNKYLYNFIFKKNLEEKIIASINELYAKIIRDLESDVNIGRFTIEDFHTYDFVEIPITRLPKIKEQKIVWIEKRFKHIRSYFKDNSFLIQKKEDSLNVLVNGNCAIIAERKDGKKIIGLELSKTNFNLSFQKNVEDDSLLLYTGMKKIEGLEKQNFSKPSQMLYKLPGKLSDYLFLNSFTKKEVKPKKNNKSTFDDLQMLLTETKSLHPSLLRKNAKNKIIRLGSGEVIIDENLIIKAGDELILQPGTNIELRNGAGIFCFGKFTAIGKGDDGDDNGIKIFQSKKTKSKTSTLAIIGEGSKDSVLHNVEVFGGGASRLGFRVFKGMVNIYNSPMARVTNCSFYGNTKGDDCINIAESKFFMQGSRVSAATFDGLDIDFGSGEINNCEFINCGNDGLDLMSSSVKVTDSRFINCGDKGMSVGERSEVYASNCLFDNNKIGFEVKDDSRFFLDKSEVVNCDLGLNLYQKKHIYSFGGKALLQNCDFYDNKKKIAVGKYCKVWLPKNSQHLSSEKASQRIIILEPNFELPPSWQKLFNKFSGN